MKTVNDSPHGRPGAVPASGIRTYALLFCTQWLAMTGTALTGLVLGIYVYRDMERGSVSLIMLGIAYASPYLPFVFTSPFAGALVDRWGQRRALLVANIGTVANSSVLIVLMLLDSVLWVEATAILAVSAIFKGLQMAALESSVPLLVPKRHLLRANGSRMVLTGTAPVIATVLVSLLLLVFDPVVVILLECTTVIIAALAARSVTVPPPPPTLAAPSGSLLADIRRAWGYLRSRHGLIPLVVGFLGAISCVLAFVEVALPEIVYAFTGAGDLAVVLTAAYAGMIGTSVAITIWGRPRRLIPGMLIAGLVFAVGLVVSGLRPNVVLIAVAGFVAMGVTPIIMATLQTVVHTKVEPGLMGRVVGLKNTVIGGAHVSGNVLAGLLGAAFLPLVGREEVRSDALAVLVGNGPGRWYAVLMMMAAVVVAVTVYLAYRSRSLRHAQDALPDVTPEDRPTPIADAVDAPVPAPR